MPRESELAASVRVRIYRTFVESGAAPSVADIAGDLAIDAGEVERAFAELAALRVLTLDSGGAIRMAHPFSAVPTPHAVRAGSVRYQANCAWDVLGVAAVCGRDTEAVSACPDCGEPVDLSVRGGSVSGFGVLHFPVSPDRFWDNIAFT